MLLRNGLVAPYQVLTIVTHVSATMYKVDNVNYVTSLIGHLFFAPNGQYSRFNLVGG